MHGAQMEMYRGLLLDPSVETLPAAISLCLSGDLSLGSGTKLSSVGIVEPAADYPNMRYDV